MLLLLLVVVLLVLVLLLLASAFTLKTPGHLKGAFSVIVMDCLQL